MIDRIKIFANSKPWFWRFRAWRGRVGFAFEYQAYQWGAKVTKSKASARILGSFAWLGVKSLIWVVLILAALIFVERYVENDLLLLSPLSTDHKKFSMDQLRLYAQLLTAIFSIYFATIGIILSAGYTRLRRDIIQMLTNEQVGSAYSRVLVFAAIFCLVATALPLFGFEPSQLVYTVGTILTLLSALALFPLGQRLFHFFDLNLLVRSEVLPKIARHIEGAANRRNSISLANHHSNQARHALEQLSYIDDRIKADTERLEDTLPALSRDYTVLLLHYLKRKHTINHESYWFPRRSKYKRWFLAGDSTTNMALETSNQGMLVEEKLDHQWFENEVVDRLAGHIELAFQVGDLDLALTLFGRFSTRISAYAERFQFDIGMKEVKKFKEVIEQGFASIDGVLDDETTQATIGIADTWAALGSNLCLETLRRMMTFEKEFEQFIEADEWSNMSIHRLPAFLQVELAFIVDRIEFEEEFEGQRLSKPKYVQQLAVQHLLLHYSKVLPSVVDFYLIIIPEFVGSLAKFKMSEAATQVVLASLHSHWKLPNRFDDLALLIGRYQKYSHYTEKPYMLVEIDISDMSRKLAIAQDNAIAMLGRGEMVEHIFEPKYNDEFPDHFGQIYFELAEACISAIEQNDGSKLDKVLPMFLSLAFLSADEKFPNPALDVNNEYRLHLVSTVINDLASILGFAILYGEYFDNAKLSESGLAKFDYWVGLATDKQKYLNRMVLLSDPFSFSRNSSPRSLIRINWRMSFENRARNDGFESQKGGRRGKLHTNKIVRESLRSHSDASHLFFAKHIIPQLEPIDDKINRRITDLASRLGEDHEEVLHEDL